MANAVITSAAQLDAQAPGFPVRAQFLARYKAQQLAAQIANRNEFAESAAHLQLVGIENALKYGRATIPLADVLRLVPELSAWRESSAPAGLGVQLIRSWGDADALLTKQQRDAWRALLYQRGQFDQLDAELREGRGNVTRDQVLALLGTQAGLHLGLGGQVTRESLVPRTLAESNEIWASEALAAIPAADAQKIAPAFGVRQGLSDHDTKGAIQAKLSLMATAFGVPVGELLSPDSQLARELAAGNVAGVVLAGSAGESGNFFAKLGRGFSRLVRDPLGWARRVFVTEPGKGIRQLGRAILNARRDVPMLGKFFLDPFGFTAQAVLLEQVGEAMVDGSISTFDERKFGMAAGETFAAAGEALLVAAAFIPQPFGLAAAALGALSKAAGELIKNEIARAHQKTQEARAKQQQAQDAKAAERMRGARAQELAAFAPELARIAVNKLTPALAAGFEPDGLTLSLADDNGTQRLVAWAHFPGRDKWDAIAVEGLEDVPTAADYAKQAKPATQAGPRPGVAQQVTELPVRALTGSKGAASESDLLAFAMA